MATTETVFSIAECCDEGKTMFYESMQEDIIPITQFVQHAKQCLACADVLNAHLASFFSSLPRPARVIARQMEKHITG